MQCGFTNTKKHVKFRRLMKSALPTVSFIDCYLFPPSFEQPNLRIPLLPRTILRDILRDILRLKCCSAST